MIKLKYFFSILTAIILGLLVGKVATVSFNYLDTGFLSEQKQNKTATPDAQLDLKNPDSDEKPIKIEEKITVTFVGDMMFDRHIRSWAEENSYQNIFQHVRKMLHRSDLVVGNLEGPITNYETIYKNGSIPNNYTFTFDTKVARILRDANVGVVSLDNNHIFDYGRDGAKQTEINLDSVGIAHFGNPDKRQILYHNVKGIRFAFLSFNQFIKPDEKNLLHNIEIADKNSDYVVVFPHWGNEYEVVPTENQVSLAHQFIEKGADFVIGAHPHVIQGKEIYKGKYIYYSLGNFIFDQYFDENVKCGAVVTFELDKNKIINIKEEFISLSADEIMELSGVCI